MQTTHERHSRVVTHHCVTGCRVGHTYSQIGHDVHLAGSMTANDFWFIMCKSPSVT
jgi:hypothetical protein